MRHRVNGRFGKLAAGVTACAACLWLGAAAHAASGSTSKVEVKLVEVACPAGPAGVKLRLSLATGQAVEYVPEDARAADTVLKLVDMFVSGRSRMFAELDGSNVVRALQIAGPTYFRVAE